MKKKMNSQM